ncbi:MAG: restriction endonuclease subunit S [Eubacteriales bacterium]|nr:restriction endonuclease subunit S [Eubacteriales bacterium]
MKKEIKERIEVVRLGEVPEGYISENHQLRPADWQYDKIGKYLVPYDEFSNETEAYPLATSSRQGLMLQSEYYSDQRYEETSGGFHVVPEGYVTYRHMSDDDIFRFNVNKMGTPVLVSPEYPVFTTAAGLDQDLLIAYLNNMKEFTAYCSAQKKGSTRTRMYFSRLSEFAMPIPPVEEQKRIAEILATCDRVIELKQQLLEEKRRQKQWLMQKLLVPNSGVRMPGFENTTWEKSTIASLFTFGSSMAKTRDELSGEGDLYLHYGDIHANERYYIDAKAEYEAIPKYDGASPEKTHLHNGDVVFIDASEDYDGISKFVVIENGDGLTFISGLHTIPCHSRDDRLTLHFKRYCFQTYQFKKQMAYYANGMKVYGISERDFAKVEVVFPGHEEQVAISNVLDAISMNIELLEKEIVEIGKKKKALMQLLLTGLVRVKA